VLVTVVVVVRVWAVMGGWGWGGKGHARFWGKALFMVFENVVVVVF